MAFKFDGAEEGYTSNLDLFKAPPINTAVLKREWIPFRPVSQITRGSPIHFTIPGSSSDYKNLNNMMLYVKCKIIKPGGEKVTQEDKVAFVNLTLQSLFRQTDLSLQQQVVNTGVGMNYPYKAMCDVLLKFQEDPKESLLQNMLYYKDTAGYMDSDIEDGGNLGLLQRWQLTQDGQGVDMEGNIFSDFAQQQRYLLNGVQVDVKLFPSADNFVLMAPKGGVQYQYEIEEAILKVCHVKLNPGVMVAHAETLKKTPALYPYTKSDLRTFNIQPGSFTWSADDIFQGSIPSRVVVGLVSGQAYSGTYDKNPFNFQHFNCNFCGLYANGQSVPGEPFMCNFKNDLYTSAYLSLFTGVGKHRLSEGNFINRSDFSSGYSMYVFDLDGECQDNGQEFMSLINKGHTRLNLRFEEAPTETITVVVYSHFSSILQIDSSRNVLI